jgi:hypothetical protein
MAEFMNLSDSSRNWSVNDYARLLAQKHALSFGDEILSRLFDQLLAL